jgi:hypothetical protein
MSQNPVYTCLCYNCVLITSSGFARSVDYRVQAFMKEHCLHTKPTNQPMHVEGLKRCLNELTREPLTVNAPTDTKSVVDTPKVDPPVNPEDNRNKTIQIITSDKSPNNIMAFSPIRHSHLTIKAETDNSSYVDSAGRIVYTSKYCRAAWQFFWTIAPLDESKSDYTKNIHTYLLQTLKESYYSVFPVTNPASGNQRHVSDEEMHYHNDDKIKALKILFDIYSIGEYHSYKYINELSDEIQFMLDTWCYWPTLSSIGRLDPDIVKVLKGDNVGLKYMVSHGVISRYTAKVVICNQYESLVDELICREDVGTVMQLMADQYRIFGKFPQLLSILLDVEQVYKYFKSDAYQNTLINYMSKLKKLAVNAEYHSKMFINWEFIMRHFGDYGLTVPEYLGEALEMYRTNMSKFIAELETKKADYTVNTGMYAVNDS